GVELLLWDHYRRQRVDAAAAGNRVDRPRLQPHAADRRSATRVVRTAGHRRPRGARADARPERRLLVRPMTDLRLPLGLLLAFYGVILIATGATAGTLVVGINVNLWWGGVLLIFGAAMVLLARRHRSARP